MNTYRNQNRVLGTVILLTFLLSLLFPTSTVFADDTTPPADTSGEVGLPENEDASQEEVTAPVVETTSEAEEPTDDAALPGEFDLEGVLLEEAVTENPATDVEEEPVLAQVPDGTDVVVLDEEGEAIPPGDAQEAAGCSHRQQ